MKFKLQCPLPAATGFHFNSDSVSYEAGNLIFTVNNINGAVNINEQPLPQYPPDLNKIQGFSVSTSNGNTIAVGHANEVATAIVQTKDSLITITGNSNHQLSDISTLAQSLMPVK